MAQGLTINFTVHANPLKNEAGETTYQVRQDTRGALSTKGLKDYMKTFHILPTVELNGVIEELGELLAEKMVGNANPQHTDTRPTPRTYACARTHTHTRGRTHSAVLCLAV